MFLYKFCSKRANEKILREYKLSGILETIQFSDSNNLSCT